MFHSITPVKCFLFLAAALAFVAPSAPAQETTRANEAGPSAETHRAARVEFDFPEAPEANVALDLGPGVIRDSLGLVDAAIGGLLEGVNGTNEGARSENVKFVADQVASAREATEVLAGTIEEVHARVYQTAAEASQLGQSMANYYDQALRDRGWEPILKLQEGDNGVRVSLLRDSGSIQGVFVCTFDSREVVLVSIAGDLSPENIQKLAATAAEVAAKLGLLNDVDHAVGEMRREVGARGEG